MTILEILYHFIVAVIGFTILSTDHGSDLHDKSFKDVVNVGFKTVGLLLLVGGLMHLIGLTLILPKP